MLLGKSLAAACALAITAGLAACGGSSSSGTSPAAYVKSICQAIGPFEKTVQQRSSQLNLSNIKSAADGKKALQGFLNQVATDTDKAVTKLRAAGTPDVNNGKQVSTAIVGAFTQLKSALQKAATQAGTLPTTSATAFQSAAQSLGSAVQASMSGIGGSLSNLKSPDLEAAAKKEPACTNLRA
jgi:ABC-type transporter Mla subunit MlaD